MDVKVQFHGILKRETNSFQYGFRVPKHLIDLRANVPLPYEDPIGVQGRSSSNVENVVHHDRMRMPPVLKYLRYNNNLSAHLNVCVHTPHITRTPVNVEFASEAA
jgi:hypothetical protein